MHNSHIVPLSFGNGRKQKRCRPSVPEFVDISLTRALTRRNARCDGPANELRKHSVRLDWRRGRRAVLEPPAWDESIVNAALFALRDAISGLKENISHDWMILVSPRSYDDWKHPCLTRTCPMTTKFTKATHQKLVDALSLSCVSSPSTGDDHLYIFPSDWITAHLRVLRIVPVDFMPLGSIDFFVPDRFIMRISHLIPRLSTSSMLLVD